MTDKGTPIPMSYGTLAKPRSPYDWQPIETAPKNETFVLLAVREAESGFVIGYWSEFGVDWFESEASSHSLTFLIGKPTHWMPLPDPPA